MNPNASVLEPGFADRSGERCRGLGHRSSPTPDRFSHALSCAKELHHARTPPMVFDLPVAAQLTRLKRCGQDFAVSISSPCRLSDSASARADSTGLSVSQSSGFSCSGRWRRGAATEPGSPSGSLGGRIERSGAAVYEFDHAQRALEDADPKHSAGPWPDRLARHWDLRLCAVYEEIQVDTAD
jgi:hypothetical protein